MLPKNDRIRQPRQKALVALVAACFFLPEVYANPVGPKVASGQASFSANGSVLSVTNTPGAVINWQGFSIQANETTKFIQQNAASSVLNRVVTADPSVILGALQSNGRVFLINPAGILVGAGARIDVGAFVGSTLNLSNVDFIAGKHNFQVQPGAGNVINKGNIATPVGGYVYLIGPNVANEGLIRTPQGETILAAGNSVRLIDTGSPGVSVEITASNNKAENLGSIIAESGRVGIVGAVVRNKGVISANQLVKGADGKIFLRATKTAAVEQGSRISADGDRGGNIEVSAQQGEVRVETNSSITAIGSNGTGGSINLQSAQGKVTIEPGALVNASGVFGGSVGLSAAQGQLQVGGSIVASGQRLGQSQVSHTPLLVANISRSPAIPSVDETETQFLATVKDDAPGAGLPGQGGKVQLVGFLVNVPTALIDVAGDTGGRIGVNARGDLVLGDGAKLDASGGKGGQVTIESAEGKTLVSGNIFARGDSNKGGTVRLLGEKVAILGRGRIDVSGRTGGGEALVGGDYQGKNDDVRNAEFTYVGSEASIAADAINSGDGGKIIVWANDATRTYGSISARGGAFGGDGGFVETSGKKYLDIGNSLPDLFSPTGKGGTWLLDPNDILIAVTADSNISAGSNNGGVATFTSTNDSAILSPTSIHSQLDSGVSVIVQTGGGGTNTQAGDITVSSPITKTAGGNASLTLSAHRHINIFAGITSTAGQLNLVLNAIAGNILVADAVVSAGGTMNVSAAGSLSLVASGALTHLHSSGLQTLSANNINLSAGYGSGISAQITSAGGQNISIGAGGLYLAGGGSTANNSIAVIAQTGVSAAQTLTVNGGGHVVLLGGAGSGNGNFASIRDDGTAQSLSFSAGGALTLTGGTLGSGNSASLRKANSAGTQTINGAPAITLTGGASGGAANDGNAAFIENGNGAQTIAAGAILVNGGAAGTENFAGIRASQQMITAAAVTLIGGGSALLGGARIGGIGGTAPSASNLILTATGAITLSGGSASGASIGGSPSIVTPLNVNLAIVSGGNLTLNGGTGAEARIGSPSAFLQAGNISVTAPNIALNDGTGFGGAVRSLGNVQLLAQGSGNTLSIAAGSTVAGANVAYFADRMLLAGITSGTGSVLLAPNSAARPIDLGSVVNSNASLELSNAEIGTIATAGLQIGGGTAGPIQVSANISAGSIGALNLQSGASITNSAATVTANSVNTVSVGGATLNTAAASGTIAISASITNSAATVTANSVNTVSVGGATLNTAAASGTIAISATNSGTGNINLNNTAGAMTLGANNTAAGGNIAISTLPSTLHTSGSVTAVGGNITLGAAGRMTVNHNVSTTGTGAVTLTSSTNSGVDNYAMVTGPGGLTVNTGTSNGTFTNFGGGVLTNGGNGAAVGIISNNIDLQAGSAVNGGSGAVVLKPNDPARNIFIETGTTAGALSLKPSSFQTISAGLLEIGRLDATGNLSVAALIANGDVNAATLRLIGNTVGIAGGAIGSNIGTLFNHHLEMWGNNDVMPGAVYLADNRNLNVIADRDNNLAGNVVLSGSMTVGSSTNSTGSMAAQGENIQFLGSSAVNAAIAVAGAGSQSFTARNQIVIDNTGTGDVSVTTGTGSQSFTSTVGAMTVSASGAGGAGGFSGATSGGVQTFNLAGGLTLQSRPGSSASASAVLSAGAGQTVNAQFLEVIAQGAASAGLRNNPLPAAQNASMQTIVTTGKNGAGEGIAVKNFATGVNAEIANFATGNQSITVNNADKFVVLGNTGPARNTAQGSQSVALAGTSANMLLLGGTGATGNSVIQGNNQVIAAGSGLQSGTIVLQGGALIGANALINGLSGPQMISTTGVLNAIGGTSAGTSLGAAAGAGVQQNGNSPQTVNTGGISLTGGTGGSFNTAFIVNNLGASQVIGTGSGDLIMIAGAGGTDNGVAIRAYATGATQSITTHNLSLSGSGNSGTTNAGAGIFAGSQNIQAMSGGNVTLTAGVGSGARIGGDTDANVTLTAAGSITLTANGANGVAIGSNNTGTYNNVLNITSAGNVTLSPSTGSGVRIGAPNGFVGGGNIAVSAGGSINLNGTGSFGGAIRTTGNVTLTEGASLFADTASVIQAKILNSTSTTGTSLLGDVLAETVHVGNSSSGNINVVAAQSINNGEGGSSVFNNAPGGNISVTVNGATNDLTVFNTVSAGGAINLTAGRDIVFAQPAAVNGLNASLGVTLTAGGQIIGNANAAPDVVAGYLVATAASGIGAANALETSVLSLGLNNTAGNVSVANAGALSLTGVTNAAGNLTLTATGAIAQTGPIAASNLTVTATGGMNLTHAGNLFNTLTVVNNASGNTSIHSSGALSLHGVGQAPGGNTSISTSGNLSVDLAVGHPGTGTLTLHAGNGVLAINAPVEASGAQVNLYGGNMAINAAIRNPTGTVALNNMSGGAVTVGLGQTGFGLSNAELNNIFAKNLIFNASPVTIDGPVNLTSAGTLSLNATSVAVNNNFVTSGALTIKTTGEVSVNAGTSPVTLQGGSLTLDAANVMVNGGSVAGAGAKLAASSGNMTITTTPVTGAFQFVAGVGGASAQAAGNLTVLAGTCSSCTGNLSVGGILGLTLSAPAVVTTTPPAATEAITAGTTAVTSATTSALVSAGTTTTVVTTPPPTTTTQTTTTQTTTTQTTTTQTTTSDSGASGSGSSTSGTGTTSSGATVNAGAATGGTLLASVGGGGGTPTVTLVGGTAGGSDGSFGATTTPTSTTSATSTTGTSTTGTSTTGTSTTGTSTTGTSTTGTGGTGTAGSGSAGSGGGTTTASSGKPDGGDGKPAATKPDDKKDDDKKQQTAKPSGQKDDKVKSAKSLPVCS